MRMSAEDPGPLQKDTVIAAQFIAVGMGELKPQLVEMADLPSDIRGISLHVVTMVFWILHLFIQEADRPAPRQFGRHIGIETKGILVIPELIASHPGLVVGIQAAIRIKTVFR